MSFPSIPSGTDLMMTGQIPGSGNMYIWNTLLVASGVTGVGTIVASGTRTFTVFSGTLFVE